MAVSLWAGRAGHLRMRRPSDRYANPCGLLTQLALGGRTFRSEDHTMNETITLQSEAGQAVSDSGTENGFTPLRHDEPHCVIGYLSSASAPDLYDEATLRQSALLGVLCALSSAPASNELSPSSLQCFIQAIRILSEDAAALYAGAWQALQAERH